MYISPNKTFFVTLKTMEVCREDPQALALMLAHELSHFLMEHTMSRTMSAVWRYYFATVWFRTSAMSEVYEPVNEEFKLKT